MKEEWDNQEKRLIAWNTADEFTAYFASQSDYSMSGADRKNKKLFEPDRHKCNNQRITRERIEEFIS